MVLYIWGHEGLMSSIAQGPHVLVSGLQIALGTDTKLALTKPQEAPQVYEGWGSGL